MENCKFLSWLKANWLFVFTVVCELLLFVGLFTTLVTTKGAQIKELVIDPDYGDYYVFKKAFSDRTGLDFFEMVKEGTYWPFAVLFSLVFVSIPLTFCGKYLHKNFYIATTMLLLSVGVVFLVVNKVYDVALAQHLLGKSYNASFGWQWEDVAKVSSTKLGFGSTWAAALAFASALLNFSESSNKEPIDVKDVAEIGVLSAMAIGLQFIKIQIGATGGSINLGLVPLFMVALRKGPTKGFIASAFVFGLITCITDGYGFSLYPLDYLVAFGGCAALGFFRNFCFTNDEKGYNYLGFVWIAVGVILGSLIRFVGHTASSIINYGYTLTAAMAYNYIYVFVTGGVSLVAMELLYIPLAKVNKMFPSK